MAVAGFDGYTQSEEGHYFNTVFEEKRFEEKYDQITINMQKDVKAVCKGFRITKGYSLPYTKSV